MTARRGCHPDPRPDRHARPDGDADPEADGDPDAGADRDSGAHRDACADRDACPDADRRSDADADPGADADPTPTATRRAPTPTPTPPPGTKTVNVASIPSLLSALADNTVDVIVVADGTYSISGSGNQAANSLWIGSKYASRTRPITVRAATMGGVTFDCGGGYCGGISFNGGVHDQTWDGFRFANGTTSQTGVIVFGGYSGMAAPYNISLKHITIESSCHRVGSGATDHALYFSYALEGWRNILVEDFTVNATDTMGLASGVHMDHGYASDAPNVAAHGVTVRRLIFNGNKGIASQQAIILWQPPTRDWLFDGATITNAGGARDPVRADARHEHRVQGHHVRELERVLQLAGTESRRRHVHQRRPALTHTLPGGRVFLWRARLGKHGPRAGWYPFAAPASYRAAHRRSPPWPSPPTALGPCAPGPMGRHPISGWPGLAP